MQRNIILSRDMSFNDTVCLLPLQAAFPDLDIVSIGVFLNGDQGLLSGVDFSLQTESFSDNRYALCTYARVTRLSFP